jgi:hypothetical protein
MNKSWLYAFLISGTLLASGVAQAQQHTDLIEYGLKGKVKTFTIVRYQLLTTNNGQLVPTDTNEWYRKDVFHFNKNGNIDSIRYINHYHYYKSYQQSPDTSMPFASTTFKRYFYDTKGKKTSGISMNDYSDEPSLITVSWPGKNLYVEASMVKGYNHVQSVDSIWIGKNGRDSVGSYSQFIEDHLMLVSRYHAFYNEQNDLDYYNEQNLLPPVGEMDVITMQIFTRDKEGNPANVVLTQKRGSELSSAILYRSYIYY